MDLLDSSADESTRTRISAALTPMKAATLLKPVESANYTDFYASIHHATRVGKLFRPDQPLLAQLQIRAHWLSRARFLAGGQRNSGAPAAWPNQARRRRHSRLRPFAVSRLRGRSRHVYRRAAIALGEPIPIDRAGEPHLRHLALSTTGRRATFSPGSISRWARFSPRASPPAFRPGSCRWPRLRRFAFRSHRARRTTRSLCRICATRPTRTPAPST